MFVNVELQTLRPIWPSSVHWLSADVQKVSFTLLYLKRIKLPFVSNNNINIMAELVRALSDFPVSHPLVPGGYWHFRLAGWPSWPGCSLAGSHGRLGWLLIAA